MIPFDIAWPAEKYYPRLKPYIRVAFLAGTPNRMMIADGGRHDREGFLMLTVIYPMLAGVPKERYLQEPLEIAAHFKDGTQMRYNDLCVFVPSYPQILDGYEDNGYWHVPVRIPWRCFY